ASLETLSLNFSLAPEIQAKLLAEGLTNLEELRFLFDNEEHVGRWVQKLGLGDRSMLETSRLRRAWSAVRLYFSTSEQDRSKVVLTDLDTMLEDAELRDVKQAFWKRYRLRFPAEVRSLHFQLTTVQRKRKLGENLYTEEVETEEAVSRDVDTYLDKLYTLLLAYSMAGVHPLPGADMSKEASLSASSVEFVGVPLDVMESRDAHWVVHAAAFPVGQGETQAAAGTAAPPGAQAPQVSHFKEGPSVNGKRVAAVLKDGTRLCQDFQTGKCNNPRCGKGAHKCGVVVRAQRA
ncbi:unnamed protein product, partial [Symbiodinium necroappetens]